MFDPLELEGIARTTLQRHGFDGGPVDAIDLAEALKVAIRWHSRGSAHRFGRVAHVPLNTRISRLHGLLAHELAHVLLDDFGVAQSEAAARYLGAALLVPRWLLDRQLRSGWNLQALMGYHVNASAELLARRVTEVRAAGAAIYDHGRFRYRTGVGPALADERRIVDDVLGSHAPIRVDERSGAWPVFDGSWRRVIVLSASALPTP